MSVKVSICMITYNHEKFIAQAVESIMMQETDFSYELVVGEDCSTDDTRNILLSYQEQYPHKIRLLLPESNLGMMQNFVKTLENCTGEYIALCEGDDYWTDPYKLQKQVDFLEANPDFAICFHRVEVIHEKHPERNYLSNPDQAEVTTIVNLAQNSYIHTVSCIYRNKKLKFPNWYFASIVGDYPLHLLNARYGKIKFLNETMAKYRVHEGGVWSEIPKVQQLKKWDTVLSLLIKNFSGKIKLALLKHRKKNFIAIDTIYKNLGKSSPERLNIYKASLYYQINKILLLPSLLLNKLAK
ncbi:glycosyltransferase [Pontibacter sp. SGAir0037]|uniref:glycosyltransferase n=1 Tax=Pontibacter sp. SGAir0037 TaxID=2571030 RepID=UPI0010CD2670|nr:glycosyltransferase [Pontibacter sp. SGAir0037]QCR23490.1 hypothetical protein C1N53_14835 [Pontibacter sp. SGAir0037]